MTTANKRGGKTARPKYLQELAKIAPKWAGLIAKLGTEAVNETHRVNGRKLDITSGSHCIVGEAWGF